MERPVKLSDVAALAGVSTATVSRCLNQPGQVSADLRARVQAAVDSLGYVPYAAARALASRRSRTIGAVVPTLSNPIFAAGVQGLETALEQRGYSLVLAGSNYDAERELRQARTLVERGVDGLMLAGISHRPNLYSLLRARGIPHVNTWVYSTADIGPCVGFNNRDAATRMADYLLDLGHRRFAAVSGITRDNDRAADRIAGLRDSLAKRGIVLDDRQVVEKPYGIREGRAGLHALLSSAEAPPTAIVCGNDLLALGVIIECQAIGLTVPHDVSVTGFDDIELAGHFTPPLTTMRVPMAEMGQLAADYLVNRLEGVPVPDKTLIEVELIVRGTTAPPPRP